MIDPVREMRRFVEAALVHPVPRDHAESPGQVRRRRIVVALTFVIGASMNAWALHIEAGDPTFYVATILLGSVWLVGAFASGPLHLGHAWERTGETSRGIVQGLSLGVLLLAIFLVGALGVAQIEVLRGPVEDLLDHARFGSLPLVFVITAANGISEELYHRGAVYAAAGRTHGVAVSTVLYTVVTAGSGIPLLILAAAMLGLVTGLQRRVTGGVLGPIVTHLTWSLGMLLLLPGVLSLAS